MLLETIAVGPLSVNCYILGCEKTGEGIVIDPGDDAPRILSIISNLGLRIRSVVNTHGHFDHIGGNRTVVEATGAELLIHEADVPFLARAAESAARFGLDAENSPLPDRYLVDKMTLEFGEYSLQVIHTPGHSPGGCSLHVGEILFTGDTLFANSIGRTDLPGGSHDQLLRNIKEKLFPLPDSTVVHPGHGPSSSIGHEKNFNPYLT